MFILNKDKPPGGVKVTFEARNFQEVSEGSPFAGKFQADRWKAYVEFELCHCLPVIAGPTASTGNFVGYHPAVLAKCHGSLLHQQMNLHHLIRAYNPDKIERDRIVGAVVATHYPEPPPEGWSIPEKAEDAIPMRACGVVFRQAEGATSMLKESVEKKRRWSVSIEVVPSGWEDIAIYIPSQRKIIPILEADEELLKGISQNERGQLKIGKYKGEQLVFAMGGSNGNVEFQGVGYTPRPAEAEAEIVQILASGNETDESVVSPLVKSVFPGAHFLKLFSEGDARLPGNAFWSVRASLENPVALIRLTNGNQILRGVRELVSLSEQRERLRQRVQK